MLGSSGDGDIAGSGGSVYRVGSIGTHQVSSSPRRRRDAETSAEKTERTPRERGSTEHGAFARERGARGESKRTRRTQSPWLPICQVEYMASPACIRGVI